MLYIYIFFCFNIFVVANILLPAGIIFANGDSWKEMRQFALTNLKDFGMGKKACEEKIVEESQRLIDVIQEKDGNQILAHYVCLFVKKSSNLLILSLFRQSL